MPGTHDVADTFVAAAPSPALGDDGEHDPAVESAALPLIRVEWDGSPELATQPLELGFDETAMVAVVRNLTDQSLSLVLQIVGDDGTATGTRHLALDPAVLAPLSSHSISVSVSALGFDLDGQRRSGQVHVAVDARPVAGLDPSTSAWPSYQRTSSPFLYYHPVSAGGGRVAVYGEAVLHEQFAHGDYGFERAVVPEPGVVVDRVLYGGAGVVSDRIEEPDEGGTGGAYD